MSRYESTAAERHAFQEKKRKEEILAAKYVNYCCEWIHRSTKSYRIAKKEDIAAKKILLASVEAEKKLRQPEPGTSSGDHIAKEDHPVVPKKHCEVAMIKLRMPNGKVLHD